MKIKEIPIDDLMIDVMQSRRGLWQNDTIDDMLVESIKGVGLIHEIIIRPTTTDKYGGEPERPFAVVAGSRRFHAMMRAGKTVVPCKILELDDLQAMETSLGENIGRKDLTQYEKAISVSIWFNLLMSLKGNKKIVCEICNKKLNGMKGFTSHIYNKHDIISMEDYKMKYPKVDISTFGHKDAWKEIAKKLYGNENRYQDVKQLLDIANLPVEIQMLIKKPNDRTKKEQRLLKKYGIPSHFRAEAGTSMAGIIAISKQLDKTPGSDKVDIILSVINNLDIPKSTEKEQYRILLNFRDEIKSGKTFEMAIKSIKQNEKIFSIGYARHEIIIEIPKKYVDWHKKACILERKTGEDLIFSVYKNWLKNLANSKNWENEF